MGVNRQAQQPPPPKRIPLSCQCPLPHGSPTRCGNRLLVWAAQGRWSAGETADDLAAGKRRTAQPFSTTDGQTDAEHAKQLLCSHSRRPCRPSILPSAQQKVGRRVGDRIVVGEGHSARLPRKPEPLLGSTVLRACACMLVFPGTADRCPSKTGGEAPTAVPAQAPGPVRPDLCELLHWLTDDEAHGPSALGESALAGKKGLSEAASHTGSSSSLSLFFLVSPIFVRASILHCAPPPCPAVTFRPAQPSDSLLERLRTPSPVPQRVRSTTSPVCTAVIPPGLVPFSVLSLSIAPVITVLLFLCRIHRDDGSSATSSLRCAVLEGCRVPRRPMQPVCPPGRRF